MAEALGMSQRAYQSYETGTRSMPVEALVVVQRQFGVDLTWILQGAPAVALAVGVERYFRRRLERIGG